MTEDTILNALLVAGPIVGVLLLLLASLKGMLHVCPPHQMLIFSGRQHVTPDGDVVGYRVISGDWTFQMPILEKVDAMDLRLISVPMRVQGAYSEGGIPLTVHAIANVKVSGDPRVVGNAIERFLGRGREEIRRVAKETLEGHLRGVVAIMTPEEVNEDRLKFGHQLEQEATQDLRKLGLQLDTLKIQAVSDDRSYLDSIGRKRIAEVLRAAEVAESDAVRAAEEAEAEAAGRAEVAKFNAQAKIAERSNDLRRYVAELKALIRSEEERCEAAGEAARAHAEKELQEVRAQLEGLRLQAEVTIPAEVARRTACLLAVGDAAHIEATGRATAEALALVAEAWGDAGGHALDIHVLQHLEGVLGPVTQAVKRVKVGESALVDAGNGRALPEYVAAYPAMVGSLLDEVSNTLGMDLGRAIRGATRSPKPVTG